MVLRMIFESPAIAEPALAIERHAVPAPAKLRFMKVGEFKPWFLSWHAHNKPEDEIECFAVKYFYQNYLKYGFEPYGARKTILCLNACEQCILPLKSG